MILQLYTAKAAAEEGGPPFGYKAVKSKQHVYFFYDPELCPQGVSDSRLAEHIEQIKVRMCQARASLTPAVLIAFAHTAGYAGLYFEVG